MAVNIEYVAALVNEEIPDTPLYKIQAKINRFMHTYMSGGMESVLIPTSAGFEESDVYELPENVISVDMVYVGKTRQSLATTDQFFGERMGSNQVYIGAISTEGKMAIWFGRDVKSYLSSVPVKILCQLFSADPVILPESYTICIVYYVLHLLYLEMENGKASYYLSQYELEWSKLRNRKVANVPMNLGTDL